MPRERGTHVRDLNAVRAFGRETDIRNVEQFSHRFVKVVLLQMALQGRAACLVSPSHSEQNLLVGASLAVKDNGEKTVES